MCPSCHSQTGFSLVELMVAMLLSLLLIGAIGSLSLSAARSYRATTRAGELAESGRHGLMLLTDDLEHAGFFGQYVPPADLNGQTLTDPCATRQETAFLLPVTDYDSLPTKTCSLSSRRPQTPALVIRRADTTVTTTPLRGGLYLYTRPGSFSFVANDATDIRAYHVHVYFIRSYSISSGDSIPTLMIKAPSDSNPNAQALVEGIEYLLIQYGVDSDGNGSPDRYKPDETSPGLPVGVEWQHIVTVKLSLLARSLNEDPQHTETASYALGPLRLTPGDHFHRRAFSRVVHLTNVSGRRG